MRVCETGPEWGCPPPGSRVLALGPPPVTPLAPSLLPPPAQPWGVGGWGASIRDPQPLPHVRVVVPPVVVLGVGPGCPTRAQGLHRHDRRADRSGTEVLGSPAPDAPPAPAGTALNGIFIPSPWGSPQPHGDAVTPPPPKQLSPSPSIAQPPQDWGAPTPYSPPPPLLCGTSTDTQPGFVLPRE